MTVIGADRVRAKLAMLKKTMPKNIADANRKSGEELIRIARILHPGSGENKASITGTANADGSYLADFGARAKVTEGRSGPRAFVNPALSVTRKKHKARAKRAAAKAIKDAFGG